MVGSWFLLGDAKRLVSWYGQKAAEANIKAAYRALRRPLNLGIHHASQAHLKGCRLSHHSDSSSRMMDTGNSAGLLLEDRVIGRKSSSGYWADEIIQTC